jgi:signal transduction histidine kinase
MGDPSTRATEGAQPADRASIGGADSRRGSPRKPAGGDAKARADAAAAESKLRALLAELESSNARLEEFAWVVAHDLREGLGTIGLFSEALAARLPSELDRSTTQDLDGIRAGLERLNSLINGALEAARLGASSQRHGPVDTDQAVDDALANLTARIAGSGALIAREPLPWTYGDADELTRLFQNLIGNAIEHCRPGDSPRIRIGARRDQPGWLFEVADDGPGIPADVAARAFDAAESAIGGDSGDAHGFGLAICARIVASHGGRVWAQEGPQGGTVVSFVLPGAAGRGPATQR